MSTDKLALQFADIQDVNEIEPVSAKDEECLQAVREVLERHGALHRFGITLLHRHFDVHQGERLVETCDTENRTLTIRPVSASEVNGIRLMETNWRFDDPSRQHACILWCPGSGGGSHSGSQEHRSSR